VGVPGAHFGGDQAMKHPIAARVAMLALAPLLSWNGYAADVSDRAGKMEVSVQFSNVASEDIDGGRGSTAEVDSSTGLGFNFAYNLDNHWAFGLEFSWRDADYETRVTPDPGTNPGPAFDRSGELDVGTTSLNATYHFLPSRFTPFVSGNVGRTWVDTDIPDGPPTTACWWDPWWGYYCGTGVPTKSDTYWSYGLALGLRWESKGPFFLRGLVNEQWIDVGDEVGTPSFTQYRLDLGFRF
jgi:hypothetical protein